MPNQKSGCCLRNTWICGLWWSNHRNGNKRGRCPAADMTDRQSLSAQVAERVPGPEWICHITFFFASSKSTKKQKHDSLPFWKQTVCFEEELTCAPVTDAFIRIQTAINVDAASWKKKIISSGRRREEIIPKKHFTEVNYKSQPPTPSPPTHTPSETWWSLRNNQLDKWHKEYWFSNWMSKQQKIALIQR